MGDQPLTFTSMSLSGDPDFTLSPREASSIGPNDFCTLSVNFTPSQLGPRNATVTLMDDYPGSPQIISLTGTGSALAAQGTVLGPNFPFSSGLGTLLFAKNQKVRTKSQLSFTLTNVGSAYSHILNFSSGR